MPEGSGEPLRPLRWIASSRRDYRDFPEKVRRLFGFDLYLVQRGRHPRSAKPLRGLGTGVLELTTHYDGGSFRAVYTVRFENQVYVLHAFKKKSKQGIKTPKIEIDLIRRRLAEAEADYATDSEDRRP